MNDETKTTSSEATDETPRVKRLWVSNTGRVACDDHGGMYLTAAVQRFPRRRRHDTPRDCWEAIKASERDQYHPEEFEALSCEDSRCGARIGTPTP